MFNPEFWADVGKEIETLSDIVLQTPTASSAETVPLVADLRESG